MKNQDLKNVEKKQGKLTKYKEFQQEKFTQLDLQDVEKLKHTKKLQKELEKLEEVRNVPATSEKIISEASARREVLEKEKLKEVMESLKEEPSGLQQEKEIMEKELSKSEQDTLPSGRGPSPQHRCDPAEHGQAIASDTLRDRRAAIKELQVKIPQCEQELQKDKAELEQLLQADGQTRELVRDMRQKVEEAKSSLSSNRSRGKVPDALMQQKRSGKIPDILGRLRWLSWCLRRQRGRVMRGRMGSSIGTEVTQQELDFMESKLIEKVVQLQDCQKWKLQLEEKVQRLLQQLRDMKNTNNMQSLAEQEAHLKPQIKELDDNVLAANPNKNKQKQLEKTLKDFQKASSKAGKVERLHTLIVDINSHKLKAQQDKLDKVNKELDDCSSAITKAQVAIKTAGRNLKKCESPGGD
ncbi:unnamed protein product [Oncorhynchus mykiss]|uniref:Uncharacterized protein n=1 Tax=Oncorhynchus mykiss TaxID=8022 RepID=A0A060XH64_ONCMY|nr:unnamed protein product [Oncorhynchus mykiss]